MKGYRLAAVFLLVGCAGPRNYEKVRVAILDITRTSSLYEQVNNSTKYLDASGVRAKMEEEFLHKGVTVVDDAEFQSLYDRYKRGLETGFRTTATTPAQYQPSATHGVIVNFSESFSFLTMFTCGIIPYPMEASARMIDLRTGEVRATTSVTVWTTIFSTRAPYRGARKLARTVSETLRKLPYKGRHLEKRDWPTPFQTSDTDK